MSKKSKIPQAPEGSNYSGEMRSLDELFENPKNPRVVKDGAFRKLLKSVKNAPWMLYEKPIKYVDGGVVLCGNQRRAVCIQAGYTHVPAEDVSYLNQAQRDELMVKDNAHAGEWDTEILANHFDHEALEDWGLNFGVVEFDAPSVAQAEEGSEDVDDSAQMEEEYSERVEGVTNQKTGELMFPLAIVVNNGYQLQWSQLKDQLGTKRDTDAFTRLLSILKDHDIKELTKKEA